MPGREGETRKAHCAAWGLISPPALLRRCGSQTGFGRQPSTHLLACLLAGCFCRVSKLSIVGVGRKASLRRGPISRSARRRLVGRRTHAAAEKRTLPMGRVAGPTSSN